MGDLEGGTETLYGPDKAERPSSRPSGAFANGSMLGGKYLIEKTIAEGGIGIIALAMHVDLQQRVAIKYLKTKALDNPSLVERFVREARLAAQIRSDHVVRVHDVGILPSGAPFMVMEYLVGQDLGAVVEAGPAPIATAVDYLLQACDALAEAHALHIVHRDTSPRTCSWRSDRRTLRSSRSSISASRRPFRRRRPRAVGCARRRPEIGSVRPSTCRPSSCARPRTWTRAPTSGRWASFSTSFSRERCPSRATTFRSSVRACSALRRHA